jgi:hypothetical protein
MKIVLKPTASVYLDDGRVKTLIQMRLEVPGFGGHAKRPIGLVKDSDLTEV